MFLAVHEEILHRLAKHKDSVALPWHPTSTLPTPNFETTMFANEIMRFLDLGHLSYEHST